jgi:hypothetical protein
LGIAAVTAGIYELNKYINVLQTEANAKLAQSAANQAQQSNIQFAQQQMATAQAAGDEAGVAQWQQVLQANASYQPAPPGTTGSFSDFFMQNWPWFLAGGVGLIVLSKI